MQLGPLAYTVAGLDLDKAVEWGGWAGYGGALDKAVDAGAYGCSGELLLKIKLELRVNDLVLLVNSASSLCLLCLLSLPPLHLLSVVLCLPPLSASASACVCACVFVCVDRERERERAPLSLPQTRGFRLSAFVRISVGLRVCV